MFGWQNENGEPIMDGAAYRFEQELDAQYAYENSYDLEDFDPRDFDDEPVVYTDPAPNPEAADADLAAQDRWFWDE